MPEFTHDWFTPLIPGLKKHIRLMGKPVERILEIGSFEGHSTLWFLDNCPEAQIICVDPFTGSADHEGIDFKPVKDRFRYNTDHYKDRIDCHETNSSDFFGYALDWDHSEWFELDLVFVDGSHEAKDVLSDLIGGFRLLNSGGLLFADDYGWSGFPLQPYRNPKPAIEGFFNCYQPFLNLTKTEFAYYAAFHKL